jgi:hypothetical protein
MRDEPYTSPSIGHVLRRWGFLRIWVEGVVTWYLISGYKWHWNNINSSSLAIRVMSRLVQVPIVQTLPYCRAELEMGGKCSVGAFG